MSHRHRQIKRARHKFIGSGTIATFREDGSLRSVTTEGYRREMWRMLRTPNWKMSLPFYEDQPQ
jgi:hypothetical protein